MKHTIKNSGKTKKKLEFEIPKEQVAEAFRKTYVQFRKKAKIPGFRNGKVPDEILDRQFGGQVAMEALNQLIHESYGHMLTEHNLQPLGEPQFDIPPLEKNRDYKFKVEVEVKPEFELKDYKEIPLKKKPVSIAEKDIELELTRLQKSRAELTPVEGEPVVQKGLVATIDFAGTIDGQPFEGGHAKDYVFDFGEGHFLKDFEEQMHDMKSGEERQVTITFPKDYFQEKLRNKNAVFRVKLVAVHNKKLPVLDDEFAKDLGKANMAEVKKEITSLLEKRQEAQFRHEYIDEAVEFLVKKHSMDVPPNLLQKEVEHTKKDKKDIEKSIRLQFIIEEIVKKEGLKVEPQEVEAHFQFLAQRTRQPVDAIKKHYQQNNLFPQLVTQILMDKTLNFLVDSAKFK